MLLLLQRKQCQPRIFRDTADQGIALLLILLLHIYTHKAVKFYFRCRHGKTMFPGVYLYGGGLIPGRRHPAGRKPLPDQLVQPELIPGKGFLDLQRKPADIRGTDRLVGVLDLFIRLFLPLYGRRILLPVLFRDISPGCRLCLLRYSGGVGTQIGNDTRGTVSFDLHTLIELLRQAHRLLGGKIQYLASLLLERRSRKGQRRFLNPFPGLNRAYFVSCAGQLLLNLLHLLRGSDGALLRLRAVIFRNERVFLTLHLQFRIQRPVLLRDEGIDLLLPVADNPKRHRLYAPGGQSPLHLRPKNG